MNKPLPLPENTDLPAPVQRKSRWWIPILIIVVLLLAIPIIPLALELLFT